MEDLKRWIRDIPDFPKPGIVFKDITPLLQDGRAFREALDGLWRPYAQEGVEAIVGAEARGFIFGAALASQKGLPFVPVRKPGKLPYRTHRVEYTLEYGKDALEIHVDGVTPGQRVLLVDDLLATGGTMRAAADLVGRCGAKVAGCAFVIELAFLPGRAKLAPHRVTSLIRYDAERHSRPELDLDGH